MSRERFGHENNIAQAVGNTFQPARAPSMFQGAFGNNFRGGLFNNAGGNIRELLLAYANVDHLPTTIHRYKLQLAHKWARGAQCKRSTYASQ